MAKRRRDRAGLKTAEIKEFRALLLQKREEILGAVLSMEDEALRREQTNRSACPIHMGDVGSDAFAIENTLCLADSERKLLVEVDEALDRIDEGTYGICLGTGEPIGKLRLRAIPWAKYSVEFASLLEKGLASVEDLEDELGDSHVTAA
ncbi:MAG: TraR/DksA family transcriptional regulator [Planctomycetota bacterium]